MCEASPQMLIQPTVEMLTQPTLDMLTQPTVEMLIQPTVEVHSDVCSVVQTSAVVADSCFDTFFGRGRLKSNARVQHLMLNTRTQQAQA